MKISALKPKLRHLSVTICSLLLAAGVAFVFAAKQRPPAPGTAAPIYSIDEQSINVAYDSGTPQRISVSGLVNATRDVSPDRKIALEINGAPYPAVAIPDPDGEFSFRNVIVSPGVLRMLFSPSASGDSREPNPIGTYKILLAVGSISGTVKPMGVESGIQAAQVTLKNTAANTSVSAETDENGFFASPPLPAGSYELKIETGGRYKPLEVKNLVLNEDGQYNLTGELRLAEASGADAEPKVDLQPRKEPGVKKVFLYPAGAPQPLRRYVKANVSFRSLTLELSGQLPFNDARIKMLSEDGRRAAPYFIQSVFNDFRVGGKSLNQFFGDVAILDVNSGTDKEFFIKSQPTSRLFKAGFDMEFTWPFDTDWRAPRNNSDVFEFAVKDYTLTDFPVVKRQGNSAFWPNREGAEPGSRKLSPSFAYKIWDDPPSSIIRAMWLSPFDQLPVGDYWLIYLVRGVMCALPLVWFAWFIRTHEELWQVDDDLTTRIEKLLPWLTAALFVESVILLVRELALRCTDSDPAPTLLVPLRWVSYHYLVPPNHSKPEQNDVRVMLASTVYLAGMLGAMTFAAWALRKHAFFQWAYAILCGLSRAALMVCIALIAAGLAAQYIPPEAEGSMVRLLSFTMVVIFWVLLLWLMRAFWSRLPDWRARACALCVPAVVIIFTYYIGAIDVGAGASVPAASAVLEHQRLYFKHIQILMPYIALLGIMLLLRKAAGPGGTPTIGSGTLERGAVQLPDSHKAEWLRPIRGISGIFFVAYAVVMRENWQMDYLAATWILLPLPFIVAITLFHKFRMLTETDIRCDDLDRLAPVIHAKRDENEGETWRGALLDALKAREKQLLLNTLNKKMDSEGLNEAEVKLRSEAECFINEHNANTTLLAEEEGRTAIRVEDVALGTGPCESKWENGLLAAKKSGWLIVLLVLADVVTLLVGRMVGAGEYYWLTIVCHTIASAAYWLAVAFAFGYFFSYMKGRTGVQKGNCVALFLIISLAISGIPSGDISRNIIFLWVFFNILGLRLDYYSFERALGKEFSWKALLHFEENRSPNAIYTSIKTGITGSGVALLWEVAKLVLMYVLIHALHGGHGT